MSNHYTYLVHRKNFQAINRKKKKFEIRRLNEGVKVGDTLCLVEIDPETRADTGGILEVRVTHIQYGGEYGIPSDRMIMSIEII